eukprot:297320_1
MALFFIFLLTFAVANTQSQSHKQKLQIYALTNDYILNIQHLAVNDINDRTDLLPNYEIHTIYINDNTDITTDASIINSNILNTLSSILVRDSLLSDDNSTLTIPIILGTSSSSLSILTSPLLASFNWGQISSASTSSLLSDCTKSTSAS